jgi:two-component system chemotaxis response regulator CheB
MVKTWQDWRQALEKLDTSAPIDAQSIGCRSLRDFLDLILTAFFEFGGVFTLVLESVPEDIRQRLEYGVFRVDEFDSSNPSAMRFMKFGKDGLAGFATWNTLGKANLKKSLAPRKITVLVVDDAGVIHKLMDKWAKNYPDIEIVGHAYDAMEAEKLRLLHDPSVITLDIHMPGMSGLEYLAEIMKSKKPSRVVLMSSVERDQIQGADSLFGAGILDYIEKPRLDLFDEIGEAIASIIRSVARADVKQLEVGKRQFAIDSIEGWNPDNNLILLGSSTGGVQALTDLLPQFPPNCPPTLVVQHINENFTGALAKRLGEICRAKVVEAVDGDELKSGTIYFAPGRKQMAVENREGNLFVSLTHDPPMTRHKPSVDFLFHSVARTKINRNVVAALLTGMGRDGANGMLGLRQQGAHTIAQDEATSVVWGMPGVAVNLGAVREVVPLDSIARTIFRALKK